MLSESHFPYVLFLEGSNFLTETISIKRPDWRVVKLEYNSGMLNWDVSPIGGPVDVVI